MKIFRCPREFCGWSLELLRLFGVRKSYQLRCPFVVFRLYFVVCFLRCLLRSPHSVVRSSEDSYEIPSPSELYTPVTRVNGSCLFSSLAEVALESSLVCLFIKLLSLAVAFCCFRRSLNMLFVFSKWGKIFIFRSKVKEN